MTHLKALRLWPLGIIAALSVSIIAAPVVFELEVPGGAMTAAVLAGVLIALWWLVASRARWLERIAVAVLVPVGVVLTSLAVDLSIAGGAQGFMAYILGFASFVIAIGAWAVAANSLSGRARYLALAASFLIVGALPLLVIRTEGIKGASGFVFHWRWTPTPEELLLAKGEDEPKPLPESASIPSTVAPAAPAPVAPVAPAAPAAPVAPAYFFSCAPSCSAYN